jgi:DDE domain
VSDNPYRGHRFPRGIISESVWHYFRFGVSFRDVEEMMAARGVVVSYETIRRWCDKFGKQYADDLRRRRARPGDKWHLDEVFLKINGVTHYLWRAVDQNGVCSIFWCNPSGIVLPPFASFVGCCGQLGANHASLLLTSCAVMGAKTDRNAGRRSPAASVPEQPSRELSPTYA